MTTRLPQILVCALAIMAVPLSAYPQDLTKSHTTSDAAGAKVAQSPEFKAFLEGFIAAINAEHNADYRAKIKAYLHPKCVELLNKWELSNYLNHYYFMDPVPAKCDFVLNAIGPDAKLPFADAGVVYAVRPTYLLELHYGNTTADSDTWIFLAMEGGKWFEVFPSARNAPWTK